MNGYSPIRDSSIVVIASVVLCGLCLLGKITLLSGAVMFAVLLVYLWWSYKADQQKTQAEKDISIAHVDDDIEDDPPLSRFAAIGYCCVGFGLLVAGAVFLVDGATSIARSFGVPEDIIGLTLIALGTSLPELATGLVAAFRKHTDVLVGNVLGSSLFNIFAILGITAMIKPVPVSAHIAHFDVWIMLAATVFLMAFLWTDRKITRLEGSVMLFLYAGYIGWLSIDALG